MANEFRIKNGLIVSGSATVTGIVLDGNTITGVDDSGEFTDDDAHIMTSAGINDKFGVIAGSTSIVTVGTITTGTWNGTAIASAYLDADTAHLSGAQTFTGTKTLNSFKGTAGATVTNILDEDAMGSNSNTALATQQSIKAYADTKSVIAGNTSLVTTGTITTGVWNGTAIATGYIADNAVTLAKMAGITRGSIIIGNASGDPAALAIGSNDYVLTSDGTDIAWEAAAGGGGASAIGDLSDAVTTATSNIGLGSGALDSLASGGNFNTAVGINAGTTVSTGTMNVFMGLNAGQYVSSGGSNIGIGKGALERGSTEYNNIAIGSQSMGGTYGQTATGAQNIAIGNDALRYGSQANGGSNIAIGNKALQGTDGTSSGANYNIGIGVESLEAITTGDYNVGLGYKSLEANTTGLRNIAIGAQALDAADAENDNIAIGYDALGGAVAGGEKNVAIGNYAMDAALTGDNSVAIGYAAGGAMTDAHSCVLIGHSAGLALTTGVRNVAIGFEALKTNTTSGDNVAIGEDSLTLLSTGSTANVAIGRRSGYRITANATDNVFIGGYETGGNIASGDSNVLIGSYAGQNLNGASHSNVLIGYGAGNGGSANAANQNHAIGYDALGALSTGGKNIAIGYQSGNNITSGSNNVVIGNADVPSATADDQLSISSGDGGVTWITGNSSGGINSKAEVVAVSSNTTLTLAQTGAYIYWTAGTCTLPTSATVGTQFTVFNNTGGSATVALGTYNAIVSGWAGNAAVADHEATSYICVAATKWIQVG